ncbi:MAG: hypothetical protein N2449_01385, partial [Bacteroidales bacterium]|nr:hypothetical protein [Bacteroidales bacterium]
MCRLLTQSFWNAIPLNEDNLHQSIGNSLINQINQWNNNNLTIILDKACGGTQNVQLFLYPNKTFGNKVCQVDILILENDEIQVIIEIEESEITPVKILGKFFASAIAKYYIHED